MPPALPAAVKTARRSAVDRSDAARGRNTRLPATSGVWEQTCLAPSQADRDSSKPGPHHPFLGCDILPHTFGTHVGTA